jgi:hypothetical protein
LRVRRKHIYPIRVKPKPRQRVIPQVAVHVRTHLKVTQRPHIGVAVPLLGTASTAALFPLFARQWTQ